MKKQYQRNLKMIINILVSIIVLLLCIFLIPRILIFFMPFVVGWIISCIANPLVQFLEKKMKIRRRAGTVVVIVLVIGAISGTGYLVISLLAKQLQGFISSLPEMWESLENDISHFGNMINHAFVNLSPEWTQTLNTIGNMIGEFVKGIPSNMESFSFDGVGSMVGSIANVIIAVIMSMLSSYFFIAEREYVFQVARRIIPASVYKRYDVVYQSLKQAVGGYLKAQLKIEVWIYFLILTGLTILRVDYAFLIALAIAALDFLPIFGSGAVFWPWAVLKLLSGDYFLAVGFLIIWGVGQLARQVIQPKIVGDSVGLAPIPTLILLFVGYKAAGVIGMIIAVPIGIIILNMYEEGVFDTFLDSLKILYASLSNFRHLTQEDMEAVRIYKEQEKKRIEAKERKLKEQQEKGKEA